MVAVSNGVPARTALAMPSGTEIRYTRRKVQMPRLMDTGSFSRMSCDTSLLWKKLLPRSKRANWPIICTKRSCGGLSKP